MRTSAFISYCHKDKKWLDQLMTMLTPSIRNGLRIWSDQDIESGAFWREEINRALAEAKVAILLVSVDYLASDFIHKVELPAFLQASLEDGLRILWIRLDYCRVDQSPIWAYQAAHDDPGRLPLISLSKAKQNQALSEFSKRIDEAMAVGAD